MKKTVKLLLFLIVTSCSSSQDVVHNGFLQKRKYKKGYHLSLKKFDKKKEVVREENVLDSNFASVVSKEALEDLSKKSNLELVSSIDNAEVIENNDGVYASNDNSLDFKNVGLLQKLNQVETKGIETKENKVLKPKNRSNTRDAKDIAKIGIKILLSSLIVLGVASLLNWIFYVDFLFYVASFLLVVAIVFFVVALFFYLTADEVGLTKRIKQEKDSKFIEEEKVKKENKVYKRNKILSNIFTWGTIIIPFLFIPALVFNIKVIKNKRNKKDKNKAIWRLVALPFLTFIGLIVFVGVLDAIGVFGSTVA